MTSRRSLPRLRSVAGITSIAILSLAFAVGATGAVKLAYVTPAAMATKIRGAVPQIPTDNTSVPSSISATSCKGLPPAKGGKFNTFRCAATYGKGRATVWARALPGGKFCASSTGLASCPAGPTVPGDPRICSYAPTPPTADPNRCSLAASLVTITRAMPVNFADPGWRIRNVACKGSNLVHTCVFSSFSAYGTYYTSKIVFTESGGAWTATLSTTGGGGSSSCTAAPGPPGGATRWAAGPVPACAATG